MKANHKHYTLILFSILTLVFTVIAYLAVYKMIINQSKKGAEASTIISTQDEKRMMETQLESLFNSTKEERAFISDLFINKEEIVPFIEEIEKIDDYSNVELNISSIDSDDLYFKAHIEAEGTWHDIMHTLILIENMPYSVSINNIKLEGEKDIAVDTKKTEKKLEKKWKLSLDIRTLIYK